MRILVRVNGMLTVLNNIAWISASQEAKMFVLVDNDDLVYYVTFESDEINPNDYIYDLNCDGYVDIANENLFSELIKETDLSDNELEVMDMFNQLKAEQEADDETV